MAASVPKPDLLDRALDLAIAPGFTKLGWAVRSRAFKPLADATGKTIVITGGTAGLGLAAAEMCVRAGASVVLVGRNSERGSAALEQLKPLTSRGQHVVFVPCDMSDLGQVRKLGSNLAKAHPKLDALVLNAGVLLPDRSITSDGIELAWATNVVGPFLLEQILLGSLEAASGRVVLVTSGGAYSERLSLPDADLSGDDYNGSAVYARTKRAQIVLAQLQAEQLAERGIAVHAVHPGWADTPGVQSSLPTFRRFTAPLLRTADQGADTIAWLAVEDPQMLGSGLLWHDRMPRPRTRLPGHGETPDQRSALDTELRRLTGL